MSIDQIPLPPDVAGRLFAAGLLDVGPDAAAALAALNADLLVCLLPDEDIDLHHARFPRFGEWLRQEGVPSGQALRFEIDDGSVPDIEDMVALIDQLAVRLRAGQSVVAHCAAGWGRTSLVCGLLLIAFGTPSIAEALTAVRAARPGAGPENPDQREHLAAVFVRLAQRPINRP